MLFYGINVDYGMIEIPSKQTLKKPATLFDAYSL